MKSEVTKLEVEHVECAEQFHAYRLGHLNYPLREPVLGVMTEFFNVLNAMLLDLYGLQATVWLDLKQLHRDGGSRIFSTNARRWSPSPGFCFDPTLSPPRSLEMSDLMDVEYGTAPRIDDRSAMRVTRTAAREEAQIAMMGRATNVLLYFATEKDPEQQALTYEKYSRTAMRTCMTPGHFQSFDFYLPLLNSKGVQSSTVASLDRWLDGVSVYVREAEESDEVLILSRLDLSAMLERPEFRPLLMQGKDRLQTEAARGEDHAR